MLLVTLFESKRRFNVSFETSSAETIKNLKRLSLRGKGKELQIYLSARYSVKLNQAKNIRQHIYISQVRLKDLLAVSHKC